MYELDPKKNQTLESMQEIVLVNEIMSLIQKPNSKSFTRENSEWVKVTNENICKNIQNMISDPIKHRIFSLLQEKPHITQDIIENLDIPFTSGYRKISALVRDGLIVESRVLKKRYYKKIMEYTTIIQSVKIIMENGEMSIFVKIKPGS